MNDVPLLERVASHRAVWKWIAPLGNVVGVTCGIVGVVTDQFSSATRLWIAAAGVLIWTSSALASFMLGRANESKQDEIELLRVRIAEVNGADRTLPRNALRTLAPLIFQKGASWRLTLFALESDSSGWYLRPKLRCASSEVYEGFARTRIPLEGSVLREIKYLDLPASNDFSDAPPRDESMADWRKWQRQFISDEKAIRALRMPSTKYAWCALRQSGADGQTIGLIAETIQPSAINVDRLSSHFLPPLLEMVSRLVDVPEALEPATRD